MATTTSEAYDALREAGTSEEKARKAAEMLANYDDCFAKIETDLAVLKWMLGTVLAAVVALIVKAFAT
jgi:hypothetical protein